jgi:ZIP family zinc transporter
MIGVMNYFLELPGVYQALIATFFTWFVTALGAGLVFFFKNMTKTVFNIMLGFASGVMIAATFWSLLNPAIAMVESNTDLFTLPAWFIVAIGFMLGGLFLYAVDKLLPHLHLGQNKPEGVKTSFKRSLLLVLSITLHNIPEGLAVGVAFGAVASGLGGATLPAAIALTIGIGLQNFPEGAAVAIPLRREGMSRRKAFLFGQASGLVEPIAGFLGALLVIQVIEILPYALAFAGGAMVYVVVEELIPTSKTMDSNQTIDLATIGFLIGFVIMMILDVALG